MPHRPRRASVDVLLLGSGGREHALAVALRKSPRLGRLIVAPGNPGTAQIALNTPVDLENNEAVVALARREGVSLVVVGPEAPLVGGVVDALVKAGIAAFGPSRAAARLEGSKGFTKDFCTEFGIPTAAYRRFDEPDAARAHLRTIGLPAVIKADGLAAGKGVVIATTAAQAEAALGLMFGGRFGRSGASIVMETYLDGVEASFFTLCDGQRAVPIGSAQDFKRLGEGDTGPNTGGMGAVSPAPALTPALEAQVLTEIIEPTLAGMVARGSPFRGVLFAGLMLTRSGPKLIEYNVRFGDPETQAILPRLDADLLDLLEAAAHGRLPAAPMEFSREVAVAVVMAARGYPDAPVKGTEIRGIERASALPRVAVAQAGTRAEGARILANGGRVLTVTALGLDAEEARRRAYAAVDLIDWPEGFCRRDIGAGTGDARPPQAAESAR